MLVALNYFDEHNSNNKHKHGALGEEWISDKLGITVFRNCHFTIYFPEKKYFKTVYQVQKPGVILITLSLTRRTTS
jgi:hypothetical protein